MIRWAVSRPGVIWASALVVIIAGAVSVTRLAFATRTSIELPQLTVDASWPGVGAELVEMYVTAPTEGAVQGVRGVRRTSSESSEGRANLTVTLDPRADIQMTRLAILERLEVATADSAFPHGVRPSVSNYVPSELRDQPLLRLTVVGPYTRGTLQRFINQRVLTKISAIPGVGRAALYSSIAVGASVVYDPRLFRQLGIDPSLLSSALAGARVVRALGDESRGGSVRHIILRDEPRALEDLEILPIRTPRGRIFRLRELARIVPEEDAGGAFSRIDGDPALPLVITREPMADAIKTVAAVRAALAEIQPTLPAGVRLIVVSDDSEQLKTKLNDLIARGAIAFGLVLVVLVIALRSARGVALVMGSALVALAGTVLGLYILGIPANLLTLAGLGMGVGILVQDGLIVANRLGKAPDTVEGRGRAAARIFPAVLGATLTTVVVLVPFLHLQGNARTAFIPFVAAFGLALGWSVASSVLMIPSIGAGYTVAARRWRGLHRAYAAALRAMLRWRWATIVTTIVLIAGLGWKFYTKVPRYSWSDYGGASSYISVSVSFPRGSEPEAADRTIKEFEAIAVHRAGVSQVVVNGSRSSASMRVEFRPDAELTSVPLALLEELTQRGVLIGGASIGVNGYGSSFHSGGGGLSGGSFSIKLLGFSYGGVEALAQDLKRRLELIPRVRDVRVTSGNYWNSDRAFLATLEPDREALARFGVTAAQFKSAIAREINGTATGGTSLTIGGEETRVMLKSEGARVRTLEELRDAIVPGARGRSPVRVRDLARVGATEALSTINREDQQYIRRLTYDFRGPQKLAQRTHRAFMAAITVPVGYSVADDAYSSQLSDGSERGLWLVFALGVALVVLSVAIVFDSVWAAAMVFLSLPVALGGVMAAFWLVDAAFTREAAVGVILAVGLAVHQSILVVDAALASRRRNQREHGRAFLRASDAFRAAMDRAGMVLVVTLATLASVLPLTINTKLTDLFGAIALATAGGTVAGTVGAMFVMPAVMSVTWPRRPAP